MVMRPGTRPVGRGAVLVTTGAPHNAVQAQAVIRQIPAVNKLM